MIIVVNIADTINIEASHCNIDIESRYDKSNKIGILHINSLRYDFYSPLHAGLLIILYVFNIVARGAGNPVT